MSSIPQESPKESAVDGQGAVAGSPEPTPELSDVNSLMTPAEQQTSEQNVSLKEALDHRDEDRWELNASSSS